MVSAKVFWWGNTFTPDQMRGAHLAGLNQHTLLERPNRLDWAIHMLKL